MTTPASAPQLPLVQRLWIYQSERFPLIRTATLLAAFSSASINVSAFLSGRALPGLATYGVAFVVLLIVFFQMRACDEVKDAEDDLRFRPERAIPRGLVTLQLVTGIGIALAPAAALAAWMLAPQLLLPLAAVWVWLALMTLEFGVPRWLKEHPALYLVSHMLIMPLIDLFVTATEWLVRDGSPPQGLWLFLALSFVNGCVLEIGRKLFAPQNEREGVETYTALYGVERATQVWMACLAISLTLLAAVGFLVAAPKAVMAGGLLAFAGAMCAALKFMRAPSPRTQKAADTAAGLWVFACYMSAGFVPLLVNGN